VFYSSIKKTDEIAKNNEHLTFTYMASTDKRGAGPFIT
jgi:hypothetical protein